MRAVRPSLMPSNVHKLVWVTEPEENWERECHATGLAPGQRSMSAGFCSSLHEHYVTVCWWTPDCSSSGAAWGTRLTMHYHFQFAGIRILKPQNKEGNKRTGQGKGKGRNMMGKRGRREIKRGRDGRTEGSGPKICDKLTPLFDRITTLTEVLQWVIVCGNNSTCCKQMLNWVPPCKQ